MRYWLLAILRYRLMTLLAGGLLGAVPLLAAQAADPLLVTYGKSAPTKQGDYNHRQIIYFSVPAGLRERLHLRLFDPGVGSRLDEMTPGDRGTRTRFTLYGGAGAYVPDAASPRVVSDAEMTAGTAIASREFGGEPDTLEQWVNLGSFDPSQGDLVGDERIFRLAVEGLGGLSGNIYDVFLSTREQRNLAPDGSRTFSFLLSTRVPDAASVTEMRFRIPDDATSLTVNNFDAAHAALAIETRFGSLPVRASGQDMWLSAPVAVPADLRGAEAALSFAGGDEMPNDATFSISDSAGHLLPIEVTPRLWPPLRRPAPVVQTSALATCTGVAFDATRSADPKGNPLDYRWQFGDGGSARGPEVRHDYAGPGQYHARLELRGAPDRVGDGAARDFDVLVKAPPTAHASGPAIILAGETASFDGSASTPGEATIRRMIWSFNDGTELVGPVVRKAFSTPGHYVATLRIEDGNGQVCSSATAQVPITVDAPPVAVAGANRRAAAGDRVVFNGAHSYDPDGSISRYQWDFGDGSSGEGVAPNHVYAAPGRYAVTLTVTDDSGLERARASDRLIVTINAPPVAVAGHDVAAAIDEPIRFDGSSSYAPGGRIIGWEWDFGDGAAATGDKPVYAYHKAGTYQVRLRVRNDSETRTATSDSTLTVRINQPPVAVAGPDQLLTTSVARFDGSASYDPDGRIVAWSWDFGDGTTASGPVVEHAYARHGKYFVYLTVTDDSGTRNNTDRITRVVVIKTPPVADAGPRQVGAPGQRLVFDASGSIDTDGDIVAYDWDFGDGTSGHGRIASHAYAASGTYAVHLTIRDGSGTANGIDYAETRAVIDARPVARAGTDLTVAPGETVRLDGSGSYAPDGRLTAWRWDFSDGGPPAAGPVVTRRFAEPGIYTAHLTVTDASGAPNATAADEIHIAVNHRPDAVAGPDIITDRLVVAFDGTKSTDGDGDPLTFHWDFGDGTTGTGARTLHTYADGGSYPVVLVVDDGKRLSNSTARAAMKVTIHRPPIAEAGGNRRVCTGDIIPFDASRSRDLEGGALRYSWDFGDGSGATLVNPTKSYRRAGTYPVTLQVQDNSGLPNNTTLQRIAVMVDQGPIAAAGGPIEACAHADISFDGSHSYDPHGDIVRYIWDFGDGGIGGGVRPNHSYAKPGDYRVFLKVQGTGLGRCEPTATDEAMVHILPSAMPMIRASDTAPVAQSVSFDGTESTMGSGHIVGYHWTFGDGGTADGPRVEHSFTTADTYNVALQLETDQTTPTCRVVVGHRPIRINAPPVAVIVVADQAAVGDEILFDGTGSHDPDGAVTAWDWDFGDGTTGSGVQTRHRYREAGSYRVRLAVTDDAGVANSRAEASAVINVRPAPTPEVKLPQVACIGDTVALSIPDSATTDQPVWSVGGRDAATGATASSRLGHAGTYDVTVTPNDGTDLITSRTPSSRLLQVRRAPVAVAGPERLACPGTPVAFDGSASVAPDGAPLHQAWNFGDGAAAEGERVSHSYATPGAYLVRLTASDGSGLHCAAAAAETKVSVDATPIAAAEPIREAFIGGANDAVILDASRSRHPQGRALEYIWQLGDGTTESGERVRHLFRKPGEIPVKLIVRDATGLSCGAASDSFTVNVRTREPVASGGKMALTARQRTASGAPP